MQPLGLMVRSPLPANFTSRARRRARALAPVARCGGRGTLTQRLQGLREACRRAIGRGRVRVGTAQQRRAPVRIGVAVRRCFSTWCLVIAASASARRSVLADD